MSENIRKICRYSFLCLIFFPSWSPKCKQFNWRHFQKYFPRLAQIAWGIYVFDIIESTPSTIGMSIIATFFFFFFLKVESSMAIIKINIKSSISYFLIGKYFNWPWSRHLVFQLSAAWQHQQLCLLCHFANFSVEPCRPAYVFHFTFHQQRTSITIFSSQLYFVIHFLFHRQQTSLKLFSLHLHPTLLSLFLSLSFSISLSLSRSLSLSLSLLHPYLSSLVGQE